MAHTFVPKGNESVWTQQPAELESKWGPPDFGHTTPTPRADTTTRSTNTPPAAEST